MEAIAVVASFTGILGFIGQAVSGLATLTKFVRDAKHAPKRLEAIAKNIDSLAHALQEVRQLLTVLVEDINHTQQTQSYPGISTLGANVNDCARDITHWIAIAETSSPGSWNGIHAFFRRARIAVGATSAQEIEERILDHQQRISISLSVLGRSLDHLNLSNSTRLHSRFDILTESNVSLSAKVDILTEFNASLYAKVDEMQEEIRSLSQSVSSMASSMASPPSRLSPSQQSGYPLQRRSEIARQDNDAASCIEYCCDTLSGVDDAFIENNCIYCSVTLDEGCFDERATHIVQCHGFGRCDFDKTYKTWSGLQQHLTEFHGYCRPQQCANDNISGQFKRPQRPLPDVFFYRDGRAQENGDSVGTKLQRDAAKVNLREQLEANQNIISKIEEILYEAGILTDLRGASSFAELWPAMATLQSKSFGSSEQTSNLLASCFEVACLQETWYILGRPSFGLGQALRLRPGDFDATPLDVAEFEGWTCIQPGSYQGEADSLSNCKECSGCFTYLSIQSAFAHLRHKHFPGRSTFCDNELVPWVEKQRLTLKSLWSQRLQKCSTNYIETWLLGCFLTSSSTRMILRTSSPTKSIYLATSPEWILEFIQYWDHATIGASTVQRGKHSDGAVDSRDFLVLWELVDQFETSSSPLNEPDRHAKRRKTSRGQNPVNFDIGDTLQRDDRSSCGASTPLFNKKHRLKSNATLDPVEVARTADLLLSYHQHNPQLLARLTQLMVSQIGDDRRQPTLLDDIVPMSPLLWPSVRRIIEPCFTHSSKFYISELPVGVEERAWKSLPGSVRSRLLGPDFDPARLWVYVTSFEMHILTIYPIIYPDELHEMVRVYLDDITLKRSHPSASSKAVIFRTIQNALILLVMALGKACMVKTGKANDSRTKDSDGPPGLEYFMLAAQIISGELGGGNLVHARVYMLSALYHGLVRRPVDSWEYIELASRTLQRILRPTCSYFEILQQTHRSPESRSDNDIAILLWICTLLECDAAKGHQELVTASELEHQMYKIPFPSINLAVESGLPRYAFMGFYARLSLWKLLSNCRPFRERLTIPSYLAYSENVMAFGDVATHITPNELRFQRDDQPAGDIVAATFRAQYWHTHVLMYRRFLQIVLHLDEESPQLASEHDMVGDLAQHAIRAIIESLRAFEKVAPEQLVIFDIFGTCHSHWVNLLLMVAAHEHSTLRRYVDTRLLLSLLSRAVCFFKSLDPVSGSLAIELRILQDLQQRLEAQ